MIEGRSVIITGALGGIGGACARLFGARGARLTLVDRDEARLYALAAELGSSQAVGLALDVADEAGMARMAEAAVERFAAIDVLICAAGILRTSEQPRLAKDVSFEEWRTVIDVNLTGTFLSNRAVLPAMLAKRSGDIVNISSTSGRRGRAFDAAYSASKFGVIGFSEALADEVGRLGVRVQTVLPDAVDSPLWEQSGTAALKPTDMLSPTRVAEFIAYLVTLPRDAFLLNPVLMPSRLRVRRDRASG